MLANPPGTSPISFQNSAGYTIKSSMYYNFKTYAMRELQEACGFIFNRGRVVQVGCITSQQKRNLQRIVNEAYRNGKINAPYFRGNTLLHYAAMFDCPYLIDLLVQAGADINVISANRYKNTPIHIAVLYKNISAIMALLKYNARLNIPNAQGNIPMVTAAYKSLSANFIRSNLIPPEYTVERDGEFMNKNGRTPLDILHRLRHYTIIASLREYSQQKNSGITEDPKTTYVNPEQSPETISPYGTGAFLMSSPYEGRAESSAKVFAPEPDYEDAVAEPAEDDQDAEIEFERDSGFYTKAQAPCDENPSAVTSAEDMTLESYTPRIDPTPCPISATPFEPKDKRQKICEQSDTSHSTNPASPRTLHNVGESRNRIINELQMACGLTFKDGATLSRGWNLTSEHVTILDKIVNSTKRCHLLDVPHIGGHTLLYYAAMFNCPYLIQRLYVEGANLTQIDPVTGCSALQIAKNHNSIEAFEWLYTLIRNMGLDADVLYEQ
ncbi:MAG: ankyrin repeat domain-containing protein [Clostridia bacterium]|nr:ankyrin repeat domain-containing protein [Clostridia bacterium]